MKANLVLQKLSITWNCKQIVTMNKKGKLCFKNIRQRSYVWEVKRMADLIHSMIMGYPIPPFYARRADGIYDFLDGKQRMRAIIEFMNDLYKLVGIEPVIYENEDGEFVELDINGMLFSELPEELRDIISTYSLTVYYYDDITDEQIAKMFKKLNSGKPLSTKEMNVANCQDLVKVIEIGEHELFKSVISSRGLENRKQIPLVMKIWCMLYQEDVSFESKYFNQVMSDTIITPDQNAELTAVLDKLLDVYITIGENKEKAESKLLKRKLSSETHLISFVPYVKKAIDNGISTDMLVDFFAYFYGNTDNASISDVYNITAKSGSAKAVNIKRRDEELLAAWNEFFKVEEDLDQPETEEFEEDEDIVEEPEENTTSFTDSIIEDMETREDD